MGVGGKDGENEIRPTDEVAVMDDSIDGKLVVGNGPTIGFPWVVKLSEVGRAREWRCRDQPWMFATV
jgi:hypothetical protein